MWLIGIRQEPINNLPPACSLTCMRVHAWPAVISSMMPQSSQICCKPHCQLAAWQLCGTQADMQQVFGNCGHSCVAEQTSGGVSRRHCWLLYSMLCTSGPSIEGIFGNILRLCSLLAVCGLKMQLWCECSRAEGQPIALQATARDGLHRRLLSSLPTEPPAEAVAAKPEGCQA